MEHDEEESKKFDFQENGSLFVNEFLCVFVYIVPSFQYSLRLRKFVLI